MGEAFPAGLLSRGARRVLGLRFGRDGKETAGLWLVPTVLPQVLEISRDAAPRRDVFSRVVPRTCSRGRQPRGGRYATSRFARGTVPFSLRENWDSPQLVLRPPPTFTGSRARPFSLSVGATNISIRDTRRFLLGRLLGRCRFLSCRRRGTAPWPARSRRRK